MCPVDFDFGVFAPYLDDSKKMTESEREDVMWRIEKVMESNICRYQFAYREAYDIDRLWIREANRQSMEEVLLGLIQYIPSDATVDIYIDGCDNYTFAIDGYDYIFAQKKNTRKAHVAQKRVHQNSITYLIYWDSLSPHISAASVVAKITRDRMLCDFHEEFPEYWWNANKGYGTTKHRAAILNYGISPLHRKSYEPMKSLILSGTSV